MTVAQELFICLLEFKSPRVLAGRD